jgi:hypothetical protein
MLCQVLDLKIPGHGVLARGRDDLERRVERLDADVEADLVVALACAAVRGSRRARLVGHVHQQLRHQGPRRAVASG